LISTTQVLGSSPRGSEFQVVVRKILTYVSRQSIGLRLSTVTVVSHMGYGAAMYGWGRDSRVFSTCVRSSS
jgi:hypothetical protein